MKHKTCLIWLFMGQISLLHICGCRGSQGKSQIQLCPWQYYTWECNLQLQHQRRSEAPLLSDTDSLFLEQSIYSLHFSFASGQKRNQITSFSGKSWGRAFGGWHCYRQKSFWGYLKRNVSDLGVSVFVMQHFLPHLQEKLNCKDNHIQSCYQS